MSKGAAVLGASSGVGRAVAEELARRGHDLVLAARDARDLAAIAADLQIRHRVKVVPMPLDVTDPALAPDAFVESVVRAIGRIDLVVVTVGGNDPRDDALAEPQVIDSLIAVNYRGVVQLIAAFARLFRRQAGGDIVAVSSIAAAAPRGRNAIYSSAKAGLEAYCAGLRHALHRTPVRIQVYALGYVDTKLAFGQRLLFPVVSPQRVARHLVARLGRGEGLRYFPRFWRLVVTALSWLPAALRLRLTY